MTANLTATIDADFNLPYARLLPPPRPNLEEVVTAAIEQLEDLLLDVYVHGRFIPEPEIMWCHGARDVLTSLLACFRLDESHPL
jgi:hypothetical protein